MIKDNEMIPGLHLHDHSGKAYLNYCLGKDLGFGSFDFSVGGMGKGVGNLKMEHVIDPLTNLELLDFLEEEQILRMPALIPGLITSALSATDYYAVCSKKLGIKPSQLSAILKAKTASERDIFDQAILEEFNK
jgi:4-hydroxy 2-oxovalerate aldolase